MGAVFAIALQTARSSFRSKVFFVILILIFIATALLPSSVIGDATYVGEFRIKINYSIGAITFLTGLAALWVGTINISREIEEYQIHMVMTKPVGALKFWLGKFIGIAVLCCAVLFIAATYIYYVITSEVESIRVTLVDKSAKLLVEARQNLSAGQKKSLQPSFNSLSRLLMTYISAEETADFEALEVVESPERITIQARLAPLIKRFEEFDELNNEILTGRTFYNWTHPDYVQMATDRLLRTGRINENTPEDLRRQLLAEETRAQESKYGSLPLMREGQPVPKIFMFENLPPISTEQAFFVRYRIFAGDSLDQKPRNTAIGIAYVDEHGQPLTPISEFYLKSTRFYTEQLNPGVLEGKQKFGIAFFNMDHLGRRLGKKDVKELVIQAKDGPSVLIGATSFANNYWRCVTLIALFVIFLVIVGTTCGLCFSTPVAIMLSASYVFIGLSISSVLTVDSQYQVERYKGQLEEEAIGSDLLKSFHKVLRHCLVSVETFSRMEFLSAGKTISFGLILKAFLYEFILKGLPLVLLALYALQRREFGLVIRK